MSLFCLSLFQTYYHGEPIRVNVAITNQSNKNVKRIKIQGGASRTQHPRMLYSNCMGIDVCIMTRLPPPPFHSPPFLSLSPSVRQFASICLFSQSEYKCVVAHQESESVKPLGLGEGESTCMIIYGRICE